jgi:O-antigen/teichoic acid export membrane protein
VITLVLSDRGLYAVLAATVAGSAVNTAILVVAGRRLARLVTRVDAAEWRVLLARSIPLGVALMIATVYFRADALLLSVLRGSRDVGIYGVAYRFLEAITAFPGFFYVSVFPLLAAAARRRELPELRAMSQKSFDVLVLAALPIVAGTLVLAPGIVHALTGNQFGAAATPLRIVIVGAGLMFVNGLLAYILIALDRQVIVLWVAAASLVLNVGLNLVLIPKYGYNAAAGVATGSEVFGLTGSLWLVRRFAGFTPSLRVGAKGAVATAALTVSTLLLQHRLALAIVLGAAVYVGALVLLRTHRSLELRQLLRPSRA